MIALPDAAHFLGEPTDDPGGAPLPVIHPATGAQIAALRTATPALAERAIALALDAQRGWAATPPAARARVLARAAALIRERAEALARLETWDTGKPIAETRVADWPSGAEALDWAAGLAAGLAGQHVDLGGDFAYTRRVPLGVCAGIGAWNYPAQIACWKAAPALACGNAMIFKPAPDTPFSALRLAEILVEAGLPPGVFSVLQGGAELGAMLAGHPDIAKVSLTGSVPTGRAVYRLAAEGLKPATMELGGKSALIVCADADPDDAVAAALLGNFYSSGQICSNGTRVFLAEAIRDAFLDRLLARTARIRMGDPFDPATTFGPLISAVQRDRVLAAIAAGRAAGARLLAGGQDKAPEGFEGGFWVAPTIFDGVTDSMALAREEIFGPVMSILSFRDEAEAIARANATPYGLAAGVFTRDIARGHRIAHALQAGIVWINAYNLTPVELPFGGMKQSGFGRENGRAVVEHYSQIQTVYVGMGPVEAPY